MEENIKRRIITELIEDVMISLIDPEKITIDGTCYVKYDKSDILDDLITLGVVEKRGGDCLLLAGKINDAVNKLINT